MKMTRWFPPSLPPVRPGVYEAEWDSEHPIIDGGEWYNFFDGEKWSIGAMSTRQAAGQRKAKMPSKVHLVRWRGLMHNVEHQGLPKAVPLDGPVGPHTQEE